MKRWLCAILALVLCVGLLPMTVLAASEEPAAEPVATEEMTEETTEEATEEANEEANEAANEEVAALSLLDGETTEKPSKNPTDGEPQSRGIPFTCGDEISFTDADSAMYTTTLTAGVYSVTLTDVESIGMAPSRLDGSVRTLSGGSLFVIGDADADDHDFTVSGTGSFKIEKLTDLSSVGTALVANEAVSVNASTIYTFTSTSGGTYTLSRDEGVRVSAMYGIRYQGDNLTLEAGTTIYMEFSGSGAVRLLDASSMPALKVGETTAISGNGLYKLSITELGWYVLEATDVTLQTTVSHGREADQFIEANGKYYVYRNDTMGDLTFSFDVTCTGDSGSITVRAAQPGDFRAATWNSETKGATVTGVGFYCLTVGDTGYYTINSGEGGAARVFKGVEGVSNETPLTAGDCLYILIRDDSATCTISPASTTQLPVGTSFAVPESQTTYAYTPTESGLYCFLVNGRARINASEKAGTSYEWTMGSMSNGFYFIPLTKDVPIYFTINKNDSAEATLTFDKQENLIGKLELGNEKTGNATGYTGWSFTPDESGVYIVTAEGSSMSIEGKTLSSDIKEADQDQTSVNGTTAMELEAEATYFITTRQSGAKVQVRKLSSVAAEKLELSNDETDNTKTSSDALAVYTFDVPSNGFYAVTCTNAEVSTYEASSGLQKLGGGMNGSMAGGMGGSPTQSVNVSLEGGKTIYFFAKKSGSDTLSVKIECVDINTVTELSFGKNEVAAGLYTFKAPKDGVYVIRDAGVTVFAENNGSQKTSTSRQPAFFRLEANQIAYITVSGQNAGQTGSDGNPRPPEMGGQQKQTVTIEDDSSIVDLACDVVKEYEEASLFRFTAPADGLYMISLPQYGRVSGAKFYGVDLIERVMCVGAGSSFLLRCFICDMKAGESVYVTTNPDGTNGNWTILAQEVTGLEALDGIRAVFSGTTAADVRESVQTIGASRLLQAMQEDGAKTVATMESLENDADKLSMDGTVTTNTASDAGVESVTIIGAKLNDLTAENKTVTLTVEADSVERTLPEELDADSAVYLTIDLEGVENTSELAVPVCLTVAVPADMDAQSVRLVHYGADKTELLDPIDVYEADGTWYARFAVGGFSPFALAQSIADPVDPDDGNDDADKPAAPGGNDSNKPSGGKSGGKAPKTGDESNLALWASVLLIACGAAVVVTRRRKEN